MPFHAYHVVYYAEALIRCCKAFDKAQGGEILNHNVETLNNIQMRLVYLVRLLWRLERPDGQIGEVDRSGIVKVYE
jgi:hypothetical protein